MRYVSRHMSLQLLQLTCVWAYYNPLSVGSGLLSMWQKHCVSIRFSAVGQTYSGRSCVRLLFVRFLSICFPSFFFFRSFLSFSLLSSDGISRRLSRHRTLVIASVLLELGHGFRARGESLTLLSIQRRHEVTTGGRGSPYNVRESPLSKIPFVVPRTRRFSVREEERRRRRTNGKRASVSTRPRRGIAEYARSDFIIISFSVSLFLSSLSLFFLFCFSLFSQAGSSKKTTWQSTCDGRAR